MLSLTYLRILTQTELNQETWSTGIFMFQMPENTHVSLLDARETLSK